MTIGTRPPKPGPGYVWSEELQQWVFEPEALYGEQYLTPQPEIVTPPKQIQPPKPGEKPSKSQLVQVSKGEFGGTEYMPVSPEMEADIEERKRRRKGLFDIMKETLPDMTVSYGYTEEETADIAIKNLYKMMKERPLEFGETIRKQGQTPSTTALLMGVGASWEQVNRFFQPVTPSEDLEDARRLANESPEKFAELMRTGGRTKEKQDLLLGMGATWEQVNRIFQPYVPTPVEAKEGIVANFTAGVGDLISGIGGVFRWAGKEGIGDKLTEFGSFLQAQAKPDNLGEFNWGMLLNPEFYVTRGVRTLPSTLVLVVPGIGAYSLAGSIAGKIALGGFGRAIIAGIGGAAMSRPLESALEAAGTYDAAIEQGLSKQEASQAASETFKGNLKLMGLDAAQIAVAFAPTPVRAISNVVARGLARTAMIGGKLVYEGLTEGGEELYQQMLQKKALGDERGFLEMLADPDMKEVFSIGAIMGLGMGAGGDAIMRISGRMQNTFTPEQRTQFENEKANFVAQGLDDDVASMKAMDVMAEDKKIAKTIQDISKQVEQDIAIEQVKPKTEAARMAWERIKEKILDQRGSIGKVPEEPEKFMPPEKPEIIKTEANLEAKYTNKEVQFFGEEGYRLIGEARDKTTGQTISVKGKTKAEVYDLLDAELRKEAPPVAVPPVARVGGEPEVKPVYTVAEGGPTTRAGKPVTRWDVLTNGEPSGRWFTSKAEAEAAAKRFEAVRTGIIAPVVPEKVTPEVTIELKPVGIGSPEMLGTIYSKEKPVGWFAGRMTKDSLRIAVLNITEKGVGSKSFFQDFLNVAEDTARAKGLRFIEAVDPSNIPVYKAQGFIDVGKGVLRKEIALPKAEPGMPEAGYQQLAETRAKEKGISIAEASKQLAEEKIKGIVPAEAAKPSVVPPAVPEVPPAVETEAIRAEGRNIPTAEQKASIPPNLPPSEQVAAHINFDPDKVSLKEKFERGKNKAIVHWIDRLYPLDKFVREARKTGIELSIEENPYLLARLMEGVTSKATSFIENGTFGREFWKMEKGKAVPNYKGEGLSQILEPVKQPSAWRDFSIYLTSKRAQELASYGIETGIDPFVADASIAELEAKYPNFSKLADKIQKYQSDLLDYVQESGLINQDLRDKLKAKYYAYVPFYRVMDELASKGYIGKKMVDIVSPIKRIKGSEREIINPLESIIKNTYAMINAADRNQVGVAMARIAHDVPDVAPMFQHIKTPIARVATVTAKDLGIEIEGLSEAETEEVFNVFRPSLFKAENVATVMIDGKKQFFEVDPDLNKALHAVDAGSMGMLWKVLSAPAKWLRAGATLSPDFMIRNPARDALSAFVFSRYGFIPGIDFVKGVASILKKDAVYQLYKMSGAEHSMLVSLDRDYLQKSFKEVVEGKKFTDYVKHPLALFQIVSELGEKATRLGEFKKGLAQGALPLETGMASREVTLDFAKAGTQARAVNQIIAFFNATIRGWERPIQAFKEAPVKTSAKIFLGITLPSLILWTINHDDDRWKEIPQWQKDLFWIVMTKDRIYRIPKPFELGIIFGSLPERFLDYLVEKDPDAMKNFATNLLGSSLPGWIPTGLEPIIENITNHSFFRGVPIVSGAKKALPEEFQYTQYTSEVAKGLGSVLKLSPVKIDNLIQGWTGGLGRYATQAIDKILQGTGIVPTKIEPSLTWADIPAVRAFVVRNPIGGSSASVDKFYDVLDEYTAQEQRMKMLLDDKKMTEYESEKSKHPELLLHYDDKTNTVYSATARYLRQVSGEMSDIRKLEDKIYKATNMTPEKKRELIDGLDQIKTQLAQKALALIKNPGNEVGILEVPTKDLENKLGTVINPVPPISNEKPDVYGMKDLAKELPQAKEKTKLSDLLEKNNKILTDIANLPDSALYKIDRTVSKAGLTRIQNALLDQYDAAENKKAFLEAHPEVKVNPKVEWLRNNPESNAILALWGNADILTQKAYDIAQDLINSNDIPENAFPLRTMPPKEFATDHFKYQDAIDKFGGTSVQARLIRTNDKFNKWLGLERIDESVKGLELKVKTYETTKKYEAFSDKDSPDYKDDVIKDAEGKTARDKAQMQFRASNTEWLQDLDRIDAHSKGTRDKPTPDNIVGKWVEHGNVSRESKGYDAEEKVWYLDNPDIHKWALENKLTSDDGKKWNEPVLRIQVKGENHKIEDTIADYKKILPSIPDKKAPNYKTGYEYRIEQLMSTKEGKAFKDDQRRITAYQNEGKDLVEKWVEHGHISDEFGGNSAEAKVWLYDNRNVHQWALQKELLTSDTTTWNINVLRLDVKWRGKDTEYQAILDRYSKFETKAQDEATKAFLAKPENKPYWLDRIRRSGYELGLTDAPLVGSRAGEKTPMEKWMEYGQLPKTGYYQDRYRAQNPDFERAVKMASPDYWKGIVDPSTIPDVQYDIITQQYKEKFAAYEETDKAGKQKMKDADPEFAEAWTRRNAYSLLIGYEKYVPNYMEYYKILDADVSGDNYEDEWYLMEHPDFYEKMVAKRGWQRKDFDKVPSREVWRAYQTYRHLDKTLDKHRMRAHDLNLDVWLFNTKKVTERIETLETYEKLRVQGGPSEVEAYKRYLAEEKLAKTKKEAKEALERLKKKLGME